MSASGRPRNDVGQYDDLVDAWDDRRGAFAMLHWLAASRAGLVPDPPRGDGVLVDLGCGGGLLADHLGGRGWRHVGVDIVASATRVARRRGVIAVRGDVTDVPLAEGVADVVCAGEILEHVTDPSRVVAEACRLLRPGGVLVVDTIAATRRGRLMAVRVAERLPGLAPPGIHDPDLFVDRSSLIGWCAAGGVRLTLTGLRPHLGDLFRWWGGRTSNVRLVPNRSTAVLFQGVGVKGRDVRATTGGRR